MRPAVDGGVFAKYVAIPDFQGGRFTKIFEVLGLSANHGKREKLVAAPEFRVAIQHHMRVQNAFITEFHMRPYDAIWPNADLVPNFGKWRYDGCWVNHGRNFDAISGI